MQSHQGFEKKKKKLIAFYYFLLHFGTLIYFHICSFHTNIHMQVTRSKHININENVNIKIIRYILNGNDADNQCSIAWFDLMAFYIHFIFFALKWFKNYS